MLLSVIRGILIDHSGTTLSLSFKFPGYGSIILMGEILLGLVKDDTVGYPSQDYRHMENRYPRMCTITILFTDKSLPRACQEP